MKNLYFSSNLKFLRNKFNLTQSDVAKNLNISQGTYANYESGNREPDFNILLKISSFFNTSLDHLLIHDLKNQSFNFNININNYFIDDLINLKKTYENLLNNISNDINKKIQELDKYIASIKFDTKEEYAEELVPEIENTIDLEPSYKKKESFLEEYLIDLTENEKLSQKFIPVNVVGSVKCGSPAYAYKEVTSSIALPAKYKDCYLLRADGDSMNKLFHDGELIVCCQNKIPHNNDIVVAYIPEHEEATCKKLKREQQALELHPCSTIAYEIQRYDENSDVQIMAVVLGSLSDILKKENIDINELEEELRNYS